MPICDYATNVPKCDYAINMLMCDYATMPICGDTSHATLPILGNSEPDSVENQCQYVDKKGNNKGKWCLLWCLKQKMKDSLYCLEHAKALNLVDRHVSIKNE